MSSKDIREYRKNYYQENKEYLLAYQRWYYTNRRYEMGLIEKEEIQEKPCPSTRKFAEKKKKEKMMTKKYGKFIISFQ